MANMIYEKAKLYGITNLDNKELLSLLIPQKESSRLLQVMEKSITGLAKYSREDLLNLHFKEKDVLTVLAAVEIGKRIRKETHIIQNPDFSSPEAIADYVMEDMRFLQQESFCAAYLTTKNQLIAIKTLTKGTIDASFAKSREVFQWALRYNAASVILLHNHPSGDPEPSREDITVTQHIAKAGELMEIPVLDHIIIGDGRYVSLCERGYI